MLRQTLLAKFLVIGASVALGYLLTSLNQTPSASSQLAQLAAAENQTVLAGGPKAGGEAQPDKEKDKPFGVTGFGMTPSMKNSMQFYPGTETLGKDEMRVTFMGSAPLPRKNQSGMSIFVDYRRRDSAGAVLPEGPHAETADRYAEGI